MTSEKCAKCWFGPNGGGKADAEHPCTPSDMQEIGLVCAYGCPKFRTDDYRMKFP